MVTIGVFIKGFANIAAPLYDLTSGENKDKKSEHLDLPQEAREAFDHLKAACLQAPILAFPDFGKPFLLEVDASGIGLGAVLSQKQSDGQYHPIAYASRIMTETEQRYHSNKQEFLALKWAVTEQFHEYLSPYGKNRNEFVVRMDNNPLTYIFSSANLDAAGQRWVAQLASYNFALCHICCFESKDIPTQMTKQSFTIIYFITFKKTIHFKFICKNVHS